MIVLSQKWVEKLTKLPESGMGYHIVTITLRDGRVIENTVIVNCSEILDIANFAEEDIVNIALTQKPL